MIEVKNKTYTSLDLQLIHGLYLISLSQPLSQLRSTFLDFIAKRTSTVVFYRLYSYISQKWHHKMFWTRRTKYFSSFMGGVENTRLRAEGDSASQDSVEEYPLWSFTILFCCRTFWFGRLKCHRYIYREFVTQPKRITGCEVGFKSGILGLLTKFSDFYHLYWNVIRCNWTMMNQKFVHRVCS